jgi:hypothetical protein
MIGHKGHPEVEGTMGQLDDGIYLVEDVADVARVRPRADKLAVVTQTTLSVDDAAEILAAVKRALSRTCASPSSRTSATPRRTGRTPSSCWLPQVDVVIVVGSPTSSNSNRLRELAERLGTPAYMVDGAADLQARVVRGAAARRPDRRRLGARRAGAAGHRAPARAGRDQRAQDGRRRGDVHFPLPRAWVIAAWPRWPFAILTPPAFKHPGAPGAPVAPSAVTTVTLTRKDHHARHQPAAPRPRRRDRAAEARKTPQPFLDVERFSALEAERKQHPDPHRGAAGAAQQLSASRSARPRARARTPAR